MSPNQFAMELRFDAFVWLVVVLFAFTKNYTCNSFVCLDQNKMLRLEPINVLFRWNLMLHFEFLFKCSSFALRSLAIGLAAQLMR